MNEANPSELACIVRASDEFLRALFQLPDGVYIDSVYSPVEEPGVLMLRIRGMGYPVVAGTRLRSMECIFHATYTEDGQRLKVEWLHEDEYALYRKSLHEALYGIGQSGAGN